jgi:methyl-accepting chemotaxis protein
MMARCGSRSAPDVGSAMQATQSGFAHSQGVGHLPSAGLLRSTTIRVRLIVAFSALMVLLLATAGIGAWQLVELNQVARANVGIERLMGQWHSEIRADSIRAAVLTRSDDASLRQLLAPQMEGVDQRVAQLQQELEAIPAAGGAAVLFADIAVKGKAYLDARQRMLDKRKVGQAAEAAALLDSAFQPAAQAYLASLTSLSYFYVYASDVGNGSASAQGAADTGVLILVAVCLVGGLIQFLCCWLVTASIVRPIRVAARIAQKVAAGDLTVRIRADGHDEGTQLLQSLSDMVGNLRSLVGEVVHGAHTVTDTSAQIAHVNLDLSQRTEEQAGTLEATASSLEGLTSTVTQNAEHARKAAHLAIGASEVARRGGEVVGEVVSTMSGISRSSRRISDITGVIDAIAFQTNILALNAAVEAARAGEQGRGFAVVAAEVRSLAQRSAAAAREIKTLVDESVGQVDAGTRLVGAAGKTMDEIVDAVEEVTDLIGEIAASSQQQSSGIRQVNAAVTQMDQVVQQNASLVEEATAATESMNEQASALLQLVSRFKLQAGQAGMQPPRATVQQRVRLRPAPKSGVALQPRLT